MPLKPSEQIITISSSPATITLAIRMNELPQPIANGQLNEIDTYVITGTHTMGGNITIAPNATGVATGVTFRFIYVADVTLGANTFQIFGYSMTAPQLLQNSTITCRYNGSAWDVVLSSSFTESDIVATAHILNLAVTTAKINDLAVTTGKIADTAVTTAKIALLNITTALIADINVTTGKIALLAITTALINDLAVTTGKLADNAVTNAKLAGMTTGSLKYGLAGAAADLAIGTDTYVLQSSGGVPAWVDPNTLPISNVVRYAEVDIATAAVLTLNSVPVPIVPAQGAGKSIVVVKAAWSITYAGVAYATNTTLLLITSTATISQALGSSVLATTSTRFSTIPETTGVTASNIVANQPLNVSVLTGDPTAGTSNIKVMVWYVVQES